MTQCTVVTDRNKN